MRIFGVEFKFNGFDLWHSGNFDPASKAPINGINSGSWRIGKKVYNVANCLFSGTPTEILIYTKIPFISGSHMPVIGIEGYAYGLQSPIELKLGYYVYAGAHGYCGVVSMGAWQPVVKLFSYIENTVTYTGIALIGSIYYPQFSVSVQTEMGGVYPTGWSITSNMAGNTVYYMPSTDVVTVPYKATFSQTIALTGDVTGSATFNGVTATSIATVVVDDSHAHIIANVDGLQTTLDGKIDDSQVLTNVPVGALFTDTVYIHPANHPPAIITQDANNRFMTDAERTKLTGIATGATNYAHPTNHPPSIITQDLNNRFVTDADHAAWDAKAPTTAVTTLVNGLMIAADKSKLDGVAASANNYAHPANHPPAIITQDASNRFATDTEKATWNAKAPLASPALTGTPTAPTPATADNNTNIATTAFVKAQGYITSSGSGAKITVDPTAPTTPGPGDFWYDVL